MNHRKIFLTKKFNFEAAHNLTNYNGKCENLHGHSYALEVTISGYPDKNGMVMDFKILEQIVNAEIIDFLDHSYLNEKPGLENATSENIIMWAWSKLELVFLKIKYLKVDLEKMRLFETKSSFVEIKKNF
ncbi:MAG: 6-carboxytetrahydropterin synthase QueD [Oscillospiraceae bacterium]|jgi:6-pyruvoyltetrahydropterin/6-carboxytetrahydropterin synthase|nr:6-carboxytetrahydropterin synthase QueD [Oscillospiraceae bacterium]